MRKFSLRQIGLWVVLLAVTLSGSQCGKPTEPQPVVDAEYPIYFCNINGDKLLFKYHPNTQTMDSTLIPWEPKRGITVSADGKLLYLALEESIVIIDAESYEFIQELPYKALYSVQVSSDNKLIAITGDTLRILRTSDNEIIYSDTTYTYRGIFSKDNSSFYCGFYDSTHSGGVYKLDINEPLFTKTVKSFVDKKVAIVTPTHDQSKWILYNMIGHYCSSFEIYDVTLDSIIFQDILCPGMGSIALSADGNKVIYTAPGTPFDMGETPFFKVFDIPTNTIEAVIDSYLLFSDSSTWEANPNDVIVTPDNKYLGILSGTMSLAVFHLFDLQTLTLLDRINYAPNQYALIRMTVQNVQ